jgi:hypothetical protein
VVVTDVNDNPPVISNHQENNFALIESTPVGTLVFTVETTDADIGINGVAGHTFSLQEAGGVFSINSTGSVFTATVLDRETQASFSFQASVRDIGNREAVNTYTINVTDANDCTPTFTATE